MATMIYSGIDRPSHLNLLAAVDPLLAGYATGMVNIKHALQPSLLRAYTQNSQVPLVLDSYHYNQDIVVFHATIEQIGLCFLWISNLDEIGNQRVSDRNFEYLYAHLTLPLREKLLWILQPDGNLDELEEIASQQKRDSCESALRRMSLA